MPWIFFDSYEINHMVYFQKGLPINGVYYASLLDGMRQVQGTDTHLYTLVGENCRIEVRIVAVSPVFGTLRHFLILKYGSPEKKV